MASRNQNKLRERNRFPLGHISHHFDEGFVAEQGWELQNVLGWSPKSFEHSEENCYSAVFDEGVIARQELEDNAAEGPHVNGWGALDAWVVGGF